jgi:DNA (cytosine-5)-methyltransferase 1
MLQRAQLPATPSFFRRLITEGGVVRQPLAEQQREMAARAVDNHRSVLTVHSLPRGTAQLSLGPAKLDSMPASFSFADLFAGIGGFHAALGAAGGECWFASEIDPLASRVYEANWDTEVDGDIVPLTTDTMKVPPHDVLAAGFPCQPFSKSGFQRGMSETRGTLFWNICRVLEERKPTVILLENVRNLAGPRHTDTWATIVTSLRDLGYRVPGAPLVLSPHQLPPELGGRPQVRDRVYVLGTYVGRDRAWAEDDVPTVVPPKAVIDGWDPQDWDLAKHLPLDADTDIEDVEQYRLTAGECEWINVWDDLVMRLADRLDGDRLPGFPIWADHFVSPASLRVPTETPAWKADFLRKNAEFYARHQDVIDAWRRDHDNLRTLPPSRRKLEWQAQDTCSLWDTVMHFRPSGIRAKRATYLPALVAITQTSIVASRRRRITPREAARLQGLPEWFDFSGQPDAATYRQLGNGVNVGAAYYVFRQHVLRDADDIGQRAPQVVEAVLASPESPDPVLQPRPLAVIAESSSGGPQVELPRESELAAS